MSTTALQKKKIGQIIPADLLIDRSHQISC